jgi:hypothetical protein
MPAVASVIGVAVVIGTGVSPAAAFPGLLAIQALGYIGGVFYSLSYIRKVALVQRPVDCIRPSIITFIVLAVFGFALNAWIVVQQQAINHTVRIVSLTVFYVVICFAFAKITASGFSRMEPKTRID